MGSANSKPFGSARDRSKSREKLKRKQPEKQLLDDSQPASPALASTAMSSPASPRPEPQYDLRQQLESPDSQSILSSAKNECVRRQDLDEHFVAASDASVLQDQAPSDSERKKAARSITSPSYQSIDAPDWGIPNPVPWKFPKSHTHRPSTRVPDQLSTAKQTEARLASAGGHSAMGKFSYATAGSTRLAQATGDENPQDASCDLVHSSYAAAATAASGSPVRSNPVKPTTSSVMTSSVQDWQAIAPVEPNKRKTKRGKKDKRKKVGRANTPYLANNKPPDAQSRSSHPNRQPRFATDYDRGFSVSGHRRFNAQHFNEHWEDFLPGMYLREKDDND